jgi:hypothetical protein
MGGRLISENLVSSVQMLAKELTRCSIASTLRSRLGVRHSNSERELNACLRDKVKLQRAHGGCLGDERRRRTWTAAKSSGKPLTGRDPEISEWDNPSRDYLPAHSE